MITLSLIAALNVPVSKYESIPVPIAKYCAKVVGIPYASDNFSEQEWKRFTKCVDRERNDLR
jgi:hypothetical protein